MKASGHTFWQLQGEIILEASPLPEPAIDVAFRNLGRLLDQDARVQKLRVGKSLS